MEPRTPILIPAVERRLVELIADDEVVARVLEQLERNLRNHQAGYRANRDDADPDFLFIVPIRLLLRGRVRMLRFS